MYHIDLSTRKKACMNFLKKITYIRLTLFTLNLYIDTIHNFRLSFALLHLIVITRPHSIYDIGANCLLGELSCMSLFEKLSKQCFFARQS